MKRLTIDKLLVERGLAETEGMARSLVMAGVVLVNEQRVEKPSEKFDASAAVRIKGETSKYVGRGGLKLEKALEEFHITVNGFVCLDVGASTGGFTDCLLQHEAKAVTAVDAGTNQLDWKLRSDTRVAVRENVNARFMKPEDFSELFDLIVMDVSFISAKTILPVLIALLKGDGQIITLIKPQFEVRRSEVEKGGIVRDPDLHKRTVDDVNSFAVSIGLTPTGLIESPILGAEGNKEFLALYRLSKSQEQ
jgi:23S rRNA (cytidine1920-2'-O)/16S rRNA (cytidine1409-2'-O)-methyltransferase